MSEQRKPGTEATLYKGPGDGRVLRLSGTPGQWPEYICYRRGYGEQREEVPTHHYRHIAAGVYEHQGACLEFDHGDSRPVDRCPDCGSQILGHPDQGHRGVG